MTDDSDVRWRQRFQNYRKALMQLEKFVIKGAGLNELELQGLIKAFEYTYELAWNTIKDYYENQGETNIAGSRDVIQLAFKRGLIINGHLWMDMLKNRNRTSHTYNEETANLIAQSILKEYYAEFKKLETTLKLK